MAVVSVLISSHRTLGVRVPVVRPLLKAGYSLLRLAARVAQVVRARASDADVMSILDAEEEVLRDILGDLVFALDDHNMEAAVLGNLAGDGSFLVGADPHECDIVVVRNAEQVGREPSELDVECLHYGDRRRKNQAAFQRLNS